jgi:hypothetical protein
LQGKEFHSYTFEDGMNDMATAIANSNDNEGAM